MIKNNFAPAGHGKKYSVNTFFFYIATIDV